MFVCVHTEYIKLLCYFEEHKHRRQTPGVTLGTVKRNMTLDYFHLDKLEELIYLSWLFFVCFSLWVHLHAGSDTVQQHSLALLKPERNPVIHILAQI